MKTSLAICAVILAANVSWAQERPKFEVASIRPFVPKPGSGGILPPQSPEHLATSMALRALILRAYGLETYQLTGPDSLNSVWTIAANAAPGTTQAQQNLMLQSLLEERFHLSFHREMKELKVFDLVVAKGGVKLKDSIPTDGCSRGAVSVGGKACTGTLSEQFGIAKSELEGPANGLISPKGLASFMGYTMPDFMRVLWREAGEIVIDKTGIEGKYDIRMQYSTRNLNDDSPLPTIFDALQQQLGLKLEPTKAMIEMTVVDHVDATPTDN